MAIQVFATNYKSPALTTPPSGLIVFSLPKDVDEIRLVKIYFNQPIEGGAEFNLQLEGVDLFGANLEIADGDSSVTSAPLSVSASPEDKLSLDFPVMPDTFTYPINLEVYYDDGLGTDVYKEYVDSGDAATLASAESYADGLDATAVHLTGDESIDGVKTFTDSPIIPDPTNDVDAANKGFVNARVATVSGGGGGAVANGLVTGGQVAWESNFIFNVSTASYFINDVLYSSPEDTVTLDAADATNDRIDLIVLTSAGTVDKVTGTPAAQPSKPDIDPSTQLELTFVLVEAASTAPTTADSEDVYLENTEWTSSSSGSTWALASTNNPRTGTKCIEATSLTNNAYVQLQRATSTDLSLFNTLRLYMRSKASFGNNKTVRVQLFLNGVAVGNALTIAQNTISSFGFDTSVTTGYQLVSIPISQFVIPAGSLVNQIRITAVGAGTGFYLDDIALVNTGTVIVSGTSGLTEEQADARYPQKSNNLSDLPSPSTARTNLGLGTLATQSGTFADKANLSGATFTGPVVVPADAYGVGWNGSNEVPTKNDVYDKVEAIVAGIPGSYTDEMARDAIGSALTDSSDIDFTPNDGADTITATVKSDSITFAKIQNATANSKLVGSGAAGSGADYTEITLGTGLSMSGTTLNASGGSGIDYGKSYALASGSLLT